MRGDRRGGCWPLSHVSYVRKWADGAKIKSDPPSGAIRKHTTPPMYSVDKHDCDAFDLLQPFYQFIWSKSSNEVSEIWSYIKV